MSNLLIVKNTHQIYEGHTSLEVTPPHRDLTDLPHTASGDGYIACQIQAVRLAGTLARIALDIAGAIEATREDHRCESYLSREGCDPRAEVVDARRRADCTASLLNCQSRAHTLTENAELPYLEVCVPANRVRAWTARLERAIEDTISLDRRTLTAQPD